MKEQLQLRLLKRDLSLTYAQKYPSKIKTYSHNVKFQFLTMNIKNEVIPAHKTFYV